MLLRSFMKSATWVFLTILFGLLQLWLAIGSSLIIKNFSITHDKIILDGVLLFFVTAVVVAITIDYYFSDNNYPRWAVGILFGFFPGIIVIISVWLFGICIGKSKTDLEMVTINSLEYAVLTMSFIYALIIKALEFYQNKKLNKPKES